MSKVFFHVVMSLDGYIAPAGMELTHAHDPSFNDWMAQWMELQKWTEQQQFFRQNLQLGDGGETGYDNDLLKRTFARTGVNIMGKNMFSGGEMFWPEDAPFHTPVFVVTHQPREPWVRPGGTTFYFVNDGIHSALQQARETARETARDVVGDKDIRVAGGAQTILQFLNAGLIDEFTVSISPVFFGGGASLFHGIDRKQVKLQLVEAVNSPLVTHLHYAVQKA